MQNPVVVIGGLEKSYMQKLALYLNTRIGKDGYVELLEGSDRQMDLLGSSGKQMELLESSDRFCAGRYETSKCEAPKRKTLGTGSRFGSVCGGFAGSGTGRTDSDPY